MHQILIATYTVGGPSERILPSAVTDTECLDDDSQSHLFVVNLPPQVGNSKEEEEIISC